MGNQCLTNMIAQALVVERLEWSDVWALKRTGNYECV